LAAPKRFVHEIPSGEALVESMTEGFSPLLDEAISASRSTGPRSGHAALGRYFRERDGACFFASSDEIRAAVELVRDTRPEWLAGTLAAADDAGEGRLRVYGQQASLRSPADWAFAPLGPGDDHIYRYRPHRFAFAPRLALAHLYGHPAALGALEKLVGDWAASVEPEARFSRRQRSARTSSHVSVYRVVAISWVLAFLAVSHESPERLELLLLRILLSDGRYIADRLPHTTANNHLLADGFGLWYLGLLFPEFSRADEWRAVGDEVFRDQLLRQTYPDGCSFEHSTHYHEHACEMALAYRLLSVRNGREIDAVLARRIDAMLSFQAALTGPGSLPIAIGDATEDPLFPLDKDESWCGPALRALHSASPGDCDETGSGGAASLERAFWLSGGGSRFTVAGSRDRPHSRRLDTFPYGGFAIFSQDAGRGRLVFRTGPTEQTDIVPGHMHSDLLSVHVEFGSTALLVPSGTYTYRSLGLGWPRNAPGWREYFMSARAANGLVIDGVDPLERGGGNFPGGVTGRIAARVRMQASKQSRNLALSSATLIASNAYDGWSRSVLQVRDDYWLILDRFPARMSNRAALAFQCAVPVDADANADGHVRLAVSGVDAVLAYSDTLCRPQHLRGSRSPLGGWIAPSYGRLEAASQLFFPVPPEAVASAVAISVGSGDSAGWRSIELDADESAMTLRVAGAAGSDTIEFAAGSDHEPTQVRWRRSDGRRVVAEEAL